MERARGMRLQSKGLVIVGLLAVLGIVVGVAASLVIPAVRLDRVRGSAPWVLSPFMTGTGWYTVDTASETTFGEFKTWFSDTGQPEAHGFVENGEVTYTLWDVEGRIVLQSYRDPVFDSQLPPGWEDSSLHKEKAPWLWPVSGAREFAPWLHEGLSSGEWVKANSGFGARIRASSPMGLEEFLREVSGNSFERPMR